MLIDHDKSSAQHSGGSVVAARQQLGLAMRFVAFCIALIARLSAAEVADFGTVPKGVNPTLYDVADPIVQLDESTFNDTVFCGGRDGCSSYLVEFYSDWCGHCRAYAPLYKSLAKDIRGWGKVIKIAAMNCADPVNEVTCRANGIMFFPYLKYFPRNSTDSQYGMKLRPYQSVSEMRDQLTQVLIQDYSINHFDDWPTFDHLGDITTYGELWRSPGLKDHTSNDSTPSTMAIVFERDATSLIGAQLLLDLTKYGDRLMARRCLKGHPLVEALHITDFPSLAIFKKGERVPVLIAELRRLLLSELEAFLRAEEDLRGLILGSRKNQTSLTTTAAPDICAIDPEKCKQLYFVSESDMLKAMRYALYREVSRTGVPLQGPNLTALYAFVDTLANHFPYSTIDATTNETETFLNASGRARVVFTHMRDFIEQHGFEEPMSVDTWQSEFIKAEEDQGHPFPTGSDWEHCKGSSPQFRGYTCGLWTAFHAVTVRAFRNSLSDTTFQPIPVLHAIRDWVGSFFGCDHCRNHFLKMTTRTAKIEAQVKENKDVFMYLWRAHNIVNNRLRGRETEDPEYPKYQFPALFLCPECHSDGRLDEISVHNYLIYYYSNIRPVSVDAAQRQLSSV